MLRVFVQSRLGNIVLAAIGVIYAVASLAVLVWLVIDVWQASTMFDHLIQLALLASATCGVWFLLNAKENLGLRWGYTSPLVEKDDRQANFDLTNAEQLFAGQDGNSRALYEPYYKGWEPRLGFAYRKGEKWVFRGGRALCMRRGLLAVIVEAGVRG